MRLSIVKSVNFTTEARISNPVDPKIISEAYRDDEASAAAEYGAQFRRDIESFVSREALEGIDFRGRFELPPNRDLRYRAFLDPSGGTSDSMTLVIGHRENGTNILDALLRIVGEL